MTDVYCKLCTNVQEYNGEYHCMLCSREFIIADKEDVMNQATVAPAIARIQALETENKTLKEKLEALMAVVRAARNPEPVHTSQHDDRRIP